MAKTVTQKFFIKAGDTIAVVNAPENYLSETLTDLPADVTIAETTDGQFDMIQYFAISKEDLIPEIDSLKAALKETGVVWICYPKGKNKAKIKSDLNRDVLIELLANSDLQGNHLFL